MDGTFATAVDWIKSDDPMIERVAFAPNLLTACASARRHHRHSASAGVCKKPLRFCLEPRTYGTKEVLSAVTDRWMAPERQRVRGRLEIEECRDGKVRRRRIDHAVSALGNSRIRGSWNEATQCLTFVVIVLAARTWFCQRSLRTPLRLTIERASWAGHQLDTRRIRLGRHAER